LKNTLNRSYTLLCTLSLLLLVLTLSGCQSVEKTLGAVDYACVDITLEGHTTDSGLLGRGIVVPEGETLTPETVDLLCNY